MFFIYRVVLIYFALFLLGLRPKHLGPILDPNPSPTCTVKPSPVLSHQRATPHLHGYRHDSPSTSATLQFFFETSPLARKVERSLHPLPGICLRSCSRPWADSRGYNPLIVKCKWGQHTKERGRGDTKGGG